MTQNGLLDATLDAEVAATWFSGEFTDARIGVVAGASGCVFADLDRKNGKDGGVSLDEAWLELPDTFHYDTPNGGEHHWYSIPEGAKLTGNTDYRGIVGFDRRGGNAYVVMHSAVAPTRDQLAEAPAWLLDEAVGHDRAGFKGTIRDWLAEFGQGEIGEKVQAAINRIPAGDMGHSDMVAQQFNLIRIGAEGGAGVGKALDILREHWLARPPANHTTPQDEWDWKFDEALESGITKYGDEVAAITLLPPYLNTLDLVPRDLDLSALLGAPGTRKDWFTAIKKLVRTDLQDNQVAALAWGAPKIKAFSGEWGIDYVYQQIAEARAEVTVEQEPRENPALDPEDSQSARTQSNYDLLTVEERNRVSAWPTFIDRYIAWVKSRVRHINEPYHRSSAITAMALMSAMKCFVPEDEGTLGVNFFGLTVGDSGTGKSRALKMRTALLNEFFVDDKGYDVGSTPSIEGLHDVLLQRDMQAAFFNGDEADSTLEIWLGREYMKGGIGALTNWYENYIGPKIRTKQTSEERKGAITHFELSLWGTPTGVLDLLTEKLFKTGFLARFVWYIGDPKVITDETFKVSRGNRERSAAPYDVAARALASDFVLFRQRTTRRLPMLETDEAITRLEAAKKAMHYAVVAHNRWSILEPSVTRLGDSMRKLAALIAFAEGRDTVLEDDMLAAIAQGEEWLANVVRVSDEVVASEFQRNTDLVVQWVDINGGDVSLSKLNYAFRRWEPREFTAYLESARAQGRLNKSSDEKRIVINQGKVV